MTHPNSALTLFLVSFVLPVAAQTTPDRPIQTTAVRGDPADSRAAVPPAPYRSAFRAYRSEGVDSVLPWRAVNDEVGKIGGWRVYAGEAQQPDAGPERTEPSPALPSTRERLGKDVRWTRNDGERQSVDARVAELLTGPLSVDDAVQVALLNNRSLQAAYYELGISESNFVEAGRLPNAKAVAVERRRFEQTQRRIALDVLRIASESRKAYYAAVAAEETVRYMRDVNEVAQVGADLARRMQQAGNWSRLMQAREQGFHADAALNLARAEQARASARERLIRLLGLWGTQTQFAVPERLPALPAAPTELPDVERIAIAQRIDLQAIRQETEALASTLGLTKTTRLLNVLELGPARVPEGPSDAPFKNGYEVSFEIPLFDFRTARVARAEAIYMQAVNRAAEAAINARSEVREAYLGYRTSFDVARHYRDEIVPLRKRIADENLLRYNGMLIGVFELLADARSQIASVNASIEALRDFWIAQADLEMALIGKPALAAAPRSAAIAADAGPAH